MVRVKWDAVRVTAMSLAVLVGGVMVMLGVTNLILRVRGEPAPTWPAILGFILVGAVLLGVPTAIAMRDMLRARAA